MTARRARRKAHDAGDAFRRFLWLHATVKRWDEDAERSVREVDRAFGQLLIKEGSIRAVKQAVETLEGIRCWHAVEALAHVLRRNTKSHPAGAQLKMGRRHQEKLEALLDLPAPDIHAQLVKVLGTKGPHVAAVAALAKIDGVSARTVERRFKAYHDRTEAYW